MLLRIPAKKKTRQYASGMIFWTCLQLQAAYLPSILVFMEIACVFPQSFQQLSHPPPISSHIFPPESQSHHAKTPVATKSELHPREAFSVFALHAPHRELHQTLTFDGRLFSKAQSVYPVLDFFLLLRFRKNLSVPICNLQLISFL